jgi:hypothetical protein
VNSDHEQFGEARLQCADELPWIDHEERGKWFVKIGDDFRWYLNADAQVQAGAHWFNDKTSAERAMAVYERRAPNVSISD